MLELLSAFVLEPFLIPILQLTGRVVVTVVTLNRVRLEDDAACAIGVALWLSLVIGVVIVAARS